MALPEVTRQSTTDHIFAQFLHTFSSAWLLAPTTLKPHVHNRHYARSLNTSEGVQICGPEVQIFRDRSFFTITMTDLTPTRLALLCLVALLQQETGNNPHQRFNTQTFKS